MISSPPQKKHLKVSSIKKRLKGNEVKKVLTLKAGSLEIQWFNGIPMGKQQKIIETRLFIGKAKTFLKDIL